MAAARALSFVAELGFSRFILEGDSDLIIKAQQSKEDSLAPFGHILAAAKTTIDVNRVSFSHICRLGNSITQPYKTCTTCRRFKGVDGGCSSTPLFYIVNRPWLIQFNEIQVLILKKIKNKNGFLYQIYINNHRCYFYVFFFKNDYIND